MIVNTNWSFLSDYGLWSKNSIARYKTVHESEEIVTSNICGAFIMKQTPSQDFISSAWVQPYEGGPITIVMWKLEVLKRYLGQTMIDEAYSKAHTLNYSTVLCVTVPALFIIMKNFSNHLSNNRSFGKINTLEFNAPICWRKIVF